METARRQPHPGGTGERGLCSCFPPVPTRSQRSIGPTAVTLKQQNGRIYGALANHIWGLDAPAGANKINSTFLQPFLTYTTADSWTFSLNTKTSYDWKSKQWTVPVTTRLGKEITNSIWLHHSAVSDIEVEADQMAFLARERNCSCSPTVRSPRISVCKRSTIGSISS